MSDLTYPKLNAVVVPVAVDENTVHVRAGPWNGPVLTIEDDDGGASVTDLFDMLDGTNHIEEILDQFGASARSEVRAALAALREKGVVRDAGDERGPAWDFQAINGNLDDDDREAITDERVGVVSVGDVGRYLVESALDLDVGEVLLHQPETEAVDPAKFADDDRFRVVDADAEVDTLVADVDFLLYGATAPRPQLLDRINRATHDRGVPWMPVQALGLDGVVGPTVVPGETACYECFAERARANVPEPDAYDAHAEGVPERDQDPTPPPGMSAAVAGYASLDVGNVLAYGVGFTVGKVATIDGLELSFEPNTVLKLPRCSVCGREPGADSTRLVDLDELFEQDVPFDGGA